MQETTKPSEVIYVFLVLIATAATNLVRLVFGSLWFVGDRAVKLVTGSTESESNSEND